MAKMGYCNICGNYGQLTSDHVPPKGASGLSEVEMKTLSRYLSLTPQRPKFYQNGVKFPTLCEDCNTKRLGGQYDPALIEISKDISRLVRANANRLIALPREIKIRVRVQRVARAIVGHLLAVLPREKVGDSLIRAPFQDAMRDYFLDPSNPLPPEMAIYYWIYPSDLHVVARGFAVRDIRFRNWILGDIIKFFPLGYWLTWKQAPNLQVRLPKLISNRAGGIDDQEELPIGLRKVPPLEWPERPGNWGINLFCEEMTFVTYPRKKRRKWIV